MFKKEIFSKVVKDYNNQLEEIVEKKTFSKEVKNLLLSMLYKIENGYIDYKIVKRTADKKKTFVETLLMTIEKKCKKIELVKLMSEESKILEEKNVTFLVEAETGSITCYENEKTILEAILQLNKKEIYIEENSSLLEKQTKEFLFIGNKMDEVEALRDFDGWSWNITTKEMDNILYHFMYQSLEILLGRKILKNWVNEMVIEEEEEKEKPVNYILSGGKEHIQIDDFVSSKEKENSISNYRKVIKETLEEKYGENLTKEFLENFDKLLLADTIRVEGEKKETLKLEKEKVEQKLQKMQNKIQYLSEKSEEKKKIAEEIKQIDTVINDKDLLKKEYDKENEMLPNKEKIFSVTLYKKMLEDKREEKLEQIKNINQEIEPQEFVNRKKQEEEKVKFYQDILIKKEDTYTVDIQARRNDFEKAFLNCIKKDIENIVEKKEITEWMYILRYYSLLPVTEEINVLQEEFLKEELKSVQDLLIQKACKEQVIITISQKDVNLNQEILRNIFYSKIILLEEIAFELSYKKDILAIEIFDGTVQDIIKTLQITQRTELSVKLNKKIKIWQ